MNDLIGQVTAILRGMWRYRWQAIAAAWTAVVLGWMAVYIVVVPEYTATAQVYADTETVLRPLMKGLTLEMNLNKQVGLMARQVMSRPNLERVVALTKLDERGPKPVSRALAAERLRSHFSLTAEQPRRSDAVTTNIYNLSYVDRDPDIAIQVVRALISAFTENTLAEIRSDSQRGTRFIEKQIASQKEALAEAEKAVRDFRRQHRDVLSAEGQGFFERLQAGERAVAAAKQEIAETESLRRSLQSQLQETPASTRAGTQGGNFAPTPLELRLNELREKLAQLALKYTESHPDVVATRDNIAQVEAQIRAGQDPAPMMANPTRQQLELRVKEVTGELAALDVSKDAAVRQLEELSKQTSTLPGIEDELMRLTREIETAKAKLKALEERRQSLEMSDSVEQTSLDFYFRVIEPPSVSTASVLAAVWKKKILMSTAVLLGALAGGGGLAYALYILRPPVFSQRALNEITGFPVLGVVSRFATRSTVAKERMELSGLVILLLLMVGAYGAALFMQHGATFGARGKALAMTAVVNGDNE
jgi:polysaccharide chain length determinant protein (PEP-CTERM system associated)